VSLLSDVEDPEILREKPLFLNPLGFSLIAQNISFNIKKSSKIKKKSIDVFYYC